MKARRRSPVSSCRSSKPVSTICAIQRRAVVGGTPLAMHRLVTETRTCSAQWFVPMDKVLTHLPAKTRAARGGKIEQDIPRRIGKQPAVEEPRALLALVDDPPHQARIGQRRARGVRRRCGLLIIGRRTGGDRRGQRWRNPFEPGGNLPDLLRQPQQSGAFIGR